MFNKIWSNDLTLDVNIFPIHNLAFFLYNLLYNLQKVWFKMLVLTYLITKMKNKTENIWQTLTREINSTKDRDNKKCFENIMPIRNCFKRNKRKQLWLEKFKENTYGKAAMVANLMYNSFLLLFKLNRWGGNSLYFWQNSAGCNR